MIKNRYFQSHDQHKFPTMKTRQCSSASKFRQDSLNKLLQFIQFYSFYLGLETQYKQVFTYLHLYTLNLYSFNNNQPQNRNMTPEKNNLQQVLKQEYQHQNDLEIKQIPKAAIAKPIAVKNQSFFPFQTAQSQKQMNKKKRENAVQKEESKIFGVNPGESFSRKNHHKEVFSEPSHRNQDISEKQQRPRLKIKGAKKYQTNSSHEGNSASRNQRLFELFKERQKRFLEDEIDLECMNNNNDELFRKGREMYKKSNIQKVGCLKKEQGVKKEPRVPEVQQQRRAENNYSNQPQNNHPKPPSQLNFNSQEAVFTNNFGPQNVTPKVRVIIQSNWDQGFSVVINKNPPNRQTLPKAPATSLNEQQERIILEQISDYQKKK